MFKILVVDDMAVVREPVTSALRGGGYDAISAASGEAALTLLKAGPVDVILLDMMMPGMDGLATLSAIRELPGHENTRVILLTASSDRERIIHAAKLGVRDYLLKSSFIMKDLLERLKKYLPTERAVPIVKSNATKVNAEAVAGVPPAEVRSAGIDPPNQRRREATLRRIDNARIKSLSGTVGELLAMTNTSRCDSADVAAVLKRDPVLSMRILRIANSAAFVSARTHIVTIDDAVRHIGLREIHRVAASAGIIDTFSGGGAGLEMLRTWQHSLAVGRLMEMFAKEIDGSDPDLAYTIGLCHDLPDIMLRQYLPEESASIATLVKNGMPQHQAETQVMGISYSETARHWLPKLGLQPVINDPITSFHAAISTGQAALHGELMPTLLHMSEMYANAVMLGRCEYEEISLITKSEYLAVGGSLTQLDAEKVRLEATAVLGMFGDFPTADIRQVADQPLPKSPIHVLYVRDRRFAAFDPLEAAISLLAATVVVVADPGDMPTTLKGFDAAIIADCPDQTVVQLGSAIPILNLTSGRSGRPFGTKVHESRFPVGLRDIHVFLEQAQKDATQRHNAGERNHADIEVNA